MWTQQGHSQCQGNRGSGVRASAADPDVRRVARSTSAIKRTVNLLRTLLALPAVAVVSLSLAAQQVPARRTLQPADLFRVRQVGATAWSPDGRFVAIEFTRPGRTLDRTVPTSEIKVLDVKARTLRTLSSSVPTYLGFFNAVWSPNGRRLAFLSVDATAVVRPWIWTIGTKAPTAVHDLDVRVGFDDAPIVWIGTDRVALLAWDLGAEKSGALYFHILRGRNVADQWRRALDAQRPSVSVLESGRSTKAAAPSGRLVALDLRTNVQTTLARGGIHRLSVSTDQRFIAFLREEPGIPGQRVASYFERATDPETLYDAVNWGTERHVIDAQSGAEVAPSSMPLETITPSPEPDPADPLPRPDSRQLSRGPTSDAALYVANALDGSRLWICGGGGRQMSSCAEIWQANEWIREIKPARSESIAYTAADGTPLTAWLLLPPDHVPETKVPVITVLYPGTMYDATTPPSLSLFQADFDHPQLFAALGYAVLLPSMPPAEDPSDSHALALLSSGVVPAVDAVITRGIADPDRIAVIGQSAGAFATLGLITQTTRFRSAIASAGYSDLVSLYGTFYGQYRYGDAGEPRIGQVLRMLQLEKGYFGLGGPPWAAADRYRTNSAILSAHKVETPLMLIHGDLDFIPIQQAEEFFTALYRQDKRAMFVRYHGEWHTISNRVNVLDLWKRIADWLSETMARRK
jgi:dipeptidyl aminopeptidase/acylaminoacyl peptidase